MTSPMSVVAVDGGDLPLGGGLLALLRPALSLLRPGGQLALISSAPSVAQDLPAWCRVEHHAYLGAEASADGRTAHRIERGSLGFRAPARPTCRSGPIPPRGSRRGEPRSSRAAPSIRSRSSSATT
jgi:TusA-related sulfurtransferase